MHISDDYQHRRHNKNLLMVHLVFTTKYRKKIFYGKLREDIKNYIYEACVRNHWYIKRMETDKDHIHILLQYNPTDSIKSIVSALKQYSTYLAWRHHEETLRYFYWGGHMLWTGGYFAASAGNVSQKIIDQYIANQG